MSRPKGLPKTGGRQRGTKNRKTQIADTLASDAVGKGMTPLAYMLKVMRNSKKDGAVRLEAAKAAAPFVHPRLASVSLIGPNKDGSFTFDVNLNGADARA